MSSMLAAKIQHFKDTRSTVTNPSQIPHGHRWPPAHPQVFLRRSRRRGSGAVLRGRPMARGGPSLEVRLLSDPLRVPNLLGLIPAGITVVLQGLRFPVLSTLRPSQHRWCLSSSDQITRHGMGSRRGPRPTPITTVVPAEAFKLVGCTARPAFRCMCQPNTHAAAASRMSEPKPRSRSNRKWLYPGGSSAPLSAAAHVAPTSR